MGRTILLAMDGSAEAGAGARMAQSLASEHGAKVRVLRVIDTRSVPFPPAMDVALAIENPDRDLAAHLADVQEVRASLMAISGQAVDWPIRVALGTPANAIVDEARRGNAALIIVGLRRHGPVDRALNNETALNVMRSAECLVLGVVIGTVALPSRILAATDFSANSLLASRAARAIAGEDATLVLAYVPPMTELIGDDGERQIHDLGVRSAFTNAVRDLGDEGVTFDHVVLERGPSQTTAAVLLSYAAESNADLIAAGAEHRTRIERWMVGSVSTELVRDGRRSVLIVPPRKKGRRD
jgi:nucleotide-binding universal stress UspA family protein